MNAGVFFDGGRQVLAKRRPELLAFLLVTLVGLAGCAGDSPSQDAAPGTTTDDQSGPSGQPDEQGLPGQPGQSEHNGTPDAPPATTGAPTPENYDAAYYPELYVDDLAMEEGWLLTGESGYTGGIGLGADGCIGSPDVYEMEIPAVREGGSVAISAVKLTSPASEFRAIFTSDDETLEVRSTDPFITVFDGTPSFSSALHISVVLEVCMAPTGLPKPAVTLERTVIVPNGHPFREGNLIWEIKDPANPSRTELQRTMYALEAPHTVRISGDTNTEQVIRPGPVTKATVLDYELDNLATMTLSDGIFTAAQLAHLEGHTDFVYATISPSVRHLHVGDLDDDGSSGWSVDVAGVNLTTLSHPDGFGDLTITDATVEALDIAIGDIVLDNANLGRGPHFIGGGTWDIQLGGDLEIGANAEGIIEVTNDITITETDGGQGVRVDLAFRYENTGFWIEAEGISEGDLEVTIPGINLTQIDGTNTFTGKTPGYDAQPKKVHITGRFVGTIGKTN